MSGASCVECGRTPVVARKMCGTCYSRWRTRQKAYGRFESTWVDAEPVRAHIRALRAAGVGNRVLRAAGVSHNSITYILHGRGGRPPTSRVKRETAEKILAIPVPHSRFEYSPTGLTVDAVGTMRRLRALVAYGYTQSDLCARVGQSPTWCSYVVTGRAKRVRADAAHAVAELFDQLQMVPGTDRRSRKLAQQKGWLPPLAWDEDRIDDPTYTPEPLQHSKTVFDDFTDFEELLGLGVHVEDACRRVGVSASTLEARYRRYERDTPQELLRLVWTQRRERKRGRRREAV